MSRSRRTFRSRMRREEGQVIVIMVLFLTVLCGFAGLTIDVGRIYVAHRQLQQAVDAAALAAAQDLPVTATATSDVTTYSALAGQQERQDRDGGRRADRDLQVPREHRHPVPVRLGAVLVQRRSR